MSAPTAAHPRPPVTERMARPAGRVAGLVEAACASHPGMVRDSNQDRGLVSGRLLAVADGMGGAGGGDVAADMAIEAVRPLRDRGGAGSVGPAIREADAAVRRRAAAEPSLTGMGTTLTAVLVEDGEATVGHVGDSRAYVLRDGVLTRLTRDHSLVAELVRAGAIAAAEADGHPQRNVLIRAVGAGPEGPPDVTRHPLRPGDVVVLCSDGLHAEIGEEAIAEEAAAPGPLTAIARALVARANAGGGRDNITVVLGRVGLVRR